MGIRLFVEVLDHAPDTLTWRERHALSVLAETANDNTRECWPGIEDDPVIARRMRLPARSSRYEVMQALRTKKAIETVSAGRRGSRAVYRIVPMAPAQGPETPDPNAETGSGNSGHRVREPQTQTDEQGPGNPDPNEEKGSGNDPERVREPRTQGPGNPDPFPSHPSSPQEEEASTAGAATVPPSVAARQLTAEEKVEFGNFWTLYPKSKDYEKTLEQWTAAVIAGADPKQITAAAVAYAREKAGEEWRYIKFSANWLKARGYEDKYAPEPNGKPALKAVGSKRHQPYEPPADHSVYQMGFETHARPQASGQ